jgi:urocanate hydratase
MRMHSRNPEIEKRLQDLLANHQAVKDGWTSPEGQGLLRRALEALATAAREHFGGMLAGKLVVACGMDAAGGALSMATLWHGAAFLGIDADAERIKRHIRAGFCEYLVTDFREAVRILRSAVHAARPVSVGLHATSASVLAEMIRWGVVPDLLIDSSPANALLWLELKRWGATVLHE